MDSKLNLGFHRTQIADDSISLQLDSSLRDLPTANPVSPVPLQLLEPLTESHYCNNQNGEKEEDDDDKDVEEFRILGHSLCFKRRRESDSLTSNKREASSSSNGLDVEERRSLVKTWGNQPLSAADSEIFEIMEKEKERQFKGIELIASENFVCRAVMEALGSHLTNKYSEGMPAARYYGGNQYIDEIELLCCKRALEAFGLDSESWGVNVQPYSCTSANFAVYTGLLLPGDRIMGLDTPSGGNTSHGYYTPHGRKVSGASIFFESLPYKVNPQTGYIDFDKLEERALDFRPKILICGGSSYPREWGYARLRHIADKCGAVLMCDMAQISGLVAAKVHITILLFCLSIPALMDLNPSLNRALAVLAQNQKIGLELIVVILLCKFCHLYGVFVPWGHDNKECLNPFVYCDIVTSTTHKSLRGPRGGIIFYRKGTKPRKRGIHLGQGDESDQYDFEEKINFAVFPSLQGGPHNNHIAALAIAFKQVATPEYKAYMQQVKKNAQYLAAALLRRKCRLVTGGTDNHLLLWDLRPLGLTGKAYEKVCELCHITVNKIAIFGENGTITPGGVRIGTPAMTSRGCLESDFETIADFLLKAAHIACMVLREHGKLQKAFMNGLQTKKEILELQKQVENFATQFAMPGFDM
ncbi:hypothetical protein POTOM_001677 [Populus tomentosa]|uniref:Serine hydroxymethyltransferase-like domain-containing protein n=1 Tax=Populus tomentosa TaxID=118781 RepID=A0A8X8IVS0_POPTO|nr:hypothetical protein POTOM_001677 [Populus tomentosa]